MIASCTRRRIGTFSAATRRGDGARTCFLRGLKVLKHTLQASQLCVSSSELVTEFSGGEVWKPAFRPQERRQLRTQVNIRRCMQNAQDCTKVLHKKNMRQYHGGVSKSCKFNSTSLGMTDQAFTCTPELPDLSEQVRLEQQCIRCPRSLICLARALLF